MGSGHFSASDRYQVLKEKALAYAFLLKELGLVAIPYGKRTQL